MNTHIDEPMWKLDAKPVHVHWTDTQWQAISLRGGNILVSAAAGSGKTAVLVERIARRVIDPDDPADIDRLLVVTFTNAAAAEMNARIGQRIDEALKEQPGSLHLQRQRHLLNRAHISTLHSFCNDVIRHYYYEANIDPNVRIANDTEREIIKDEVLDELLEDYYGSRDSLFFEVVDAYSGDRGDDGLRKWLLTLFTRSRAQPDPESWLEAMAGMYENHYENVEETPWGASIQTYAREQMLVAAESLQKALSLAESPEGPDKYVDVLTSEKQMLETLIANDSWEHWHQTLKNFTFARLPAKGKDVDEAIAAQSKSYRDEAKEMIQDIATIFSADPTRHLQKIRDMKGHVRLLVTLVQQFSTRYAEAKREKAIIDYEDLEHLTLYILSEGTTDTPSTVARSYQDYFAEILTDEYQDTNRVQEAILRLLSNGHNRFMVGDVKQSIYGFRLAEPSLFLEKQKQYDALTETTLRSDNTEGIRIDLSENFRSRKQVLDGVNYVFRQTMNESLGAVPYDESQALSYGNVDYEQKASGYENEVILLDRTMQTSDDEEEDLQVAEKEGQWIAEKIQTLIENRYPVYDKKLGDTRPIEYRDITILMRSMPAASTFMDIFKQAGVPAYAEQSGGYFRRVEVQVMMALLRVIDNPYQDIPLASVLRSPIVGLRENELAEIRLKGKGEPFYEAMKKIVAEQPVLSPAANLSFIEEKQRQGGEWRDRVAAFYNHLQKWRSQARHHSLSQLIWDLFRETGYDTFVGGLPGGKERQANLHALYDRARTYEQTAFRGLFRFLRFVDRMEERGDDLEVARALGEQENVVKIMSIHKSKGLEYPVLFVAGMMKTFNFKDVQAPVQIHQSLGFGSKYMDMAKRATYQTLPEIAIKQEAKKEQLSEELRILYVAITRAKEKAILVGTAKDREKTIDRWIKRAQTDTELLPLQTRTRAQSFFDWIGPAVIRHHAAKAFREEAGAPAHLALPDHSEWQLELAEVHGFAANETEPVEVETTLANVQKLQPVHHSGENEELVQKRLDWTYSHLRATTHFAKQSVSELKRRNDSDDPYAAKSTRQHAFQSAHANRPRFMQKGEGSLSRAEIGTAMHAVMQRLPLQDSTTTAIEGTVTEMMENEQLTESQAQAIDVPAIVRFLQSDLGRRLRQSPRVYREVPFTFVKPADQVYGNWSDEEGEPILIQGVVDCLFRDEHENLVLIDYKTDQISGRESAEDMERLLRTRYEEQIRLYSEAIERIWQRSIQERYLYFFAGGYTISI
ncbi:helicase-exonuclease AddAB subunit AddA [Natribacillus halophilus]|uniref:ATP-dependent helicase/nuclease subunit A n=1 Tax=Natribacillus halophilus TaxID=549003 RepID=A0A1G8J6U0_9BACI|nr:helicase-exonuclease AddAB subunit AddA [Natribacillus halophilus]SDI26979.1 DNA helicase/exodeoxyribonuclease V, subunit A [Natribacillus halophilus]